MTEPTAKGNLAAYEKAAEIATRNGLAWGAIDKAYIPSNWILDAIVEAFTTMAPAKPAREYNGPVFEHILVPNIRIQNLGDIILVHGKLGWQLCAVDQHFVYFKRELT